MKKFTKKQKEICILVIVLVVLFGFIAIMAVNENKNPDTTNTELKTSEVQTVDDNTKNGIQTDDELTSEENVSEEVSITESISDNGVTESESISKSDDYSDDKHETIARRAFENYGKYMYPYGIKYHWYTGGIKHEYEGDGIWCFEVEVTITNEYGAEKKSIAEGRVDLTKEAVIYFTTKDNLTFR